ncbi:MAG: aspartate aminotransferase family protein [Sarcina sp.]
MYNSEYFKYMVNAYKTTEIVVKRAKGSYIYDENEKEYIDFTSGIGVNSLGHCNDLIIETIKAQSLKVMHTSNLFINPKTVELAKNLSDSTGFKKVFFSNSGAESNEAAIKIARKYSYDKYGDGRNVILTLKNSFHGRTITTISATGQEKFHKYFNPFTDGFRYIKANNIDDLMYNIKGDVCAIFIEVIQGEGGINELSKEYVNYISEICSKKDILLIVDEVQTGIGRTGKFLASEWFNLNADIITLAKGLGGGIPIGAVLCNEKTKNVISYGDHGSTFGGNPFASAIANTVINEINDEKFLENVYIKGNKISSFLRSLKNDDILEIKGKGLMIGIKVAKEPSYYIEKAKEKGLLILSARNDVLRLLPPLNVKDCEIDDALNILKSIFENI